MIEDRKREEDRARARAITSLVAAALNVPAAKVNSDSRRRQEAAARAIVYYILHCAYGMSFGRVAAAMGCDRSTVGVACHRMEDRRDDPMFDRWLAMLERAAIAVPLPILDTERAA